MTSAKLLRFTIRALGIAVLATSGLYILVYLWRWEWIRAITSGLIFLAALIVLSTSLVLASLRRVEERLDARLDRIERTGGAGRLDGTAVRTFTGGALTDGPITDSAARSRAAATIRQANTAHAGRHFDWLRETPDRMSVFVPVLLGAGALLSGLAYLIERLAGGVARASVDQSSSRLLALDLPLGAPAQRTAASGQASTMRPGRGSGVGLVVTAVLLVGSITASVVVIREATQNRVDLDDGPGRPTSIELEIIQREPTRPELEVATALWVACRGRLPNHIDLFQAGVSPEGRPTLHLDNEVGEFARRRFVGCLEDATIDRVQAKVAVVTDR